MKKIKLNILLALFVLFIPLLTLRADGDGHWHEKGIAENNQKYELNFGDWEYFYHEPFTDRTQAEDGFEYYDKYMSAQFKSTGSIFAEDAAYAIEGKGVKLSNNDEFQMTFENGLGAFYFEYNNYNEENTEIEIEVHEILLGKEGSTLKFEETIIPDKDNEVIKYRHDFDYVDIESKYTDGSYSGSSIKYHYVVTIKAKNILDDNYIVLDNIKWSDHNIKVTYADGYGQEYGDNHGENKKFYHENVRYGKVAKGPDAAFLEPENKDAFKMGYEFLGWYDNPQFNGEPFDFEKNIIRDDITLYAQWQIIYYTIEYKTNGGYFESFTTREEMIDGFLEDLYDWLVENNKLTGTDFHEWLKTENLAGDTITLEQFIGKYTDKGQVKYDGLFLKGFTPSIGGPDQENTLTYVLNGGVLETGGTLYGDYQLGKQIDDFLYDFYIYLKDIRKVLPTGTTLNDFKHGKNKTTGYYGMYEEEKYFKYLYKANTKNINESLNLFINHPKYNKWVPMINRLDSYTTAVNPAQTFWGSTYIGRFRIGQYFRKEHSNTVANWYFVTTVPGIRYGTTQIPLQSTYYAGEDAFTLAVPVRSDEYSVFNGWQEYDHLNKKWVTDSSNKVKKYFNITKADFGNKYLYATWKKPGTNGAQFAVPTPEGVELPEYLRDDSYFHLIYKMGNPYLEGTDIPDTDFSDVDLTINDNLNRFINDYRYNKWIPLLDLIHNYTTFGNVGQPYGIYKSSHTGAIRMEMFFNQDNPWREAQTTEPQYVVYEMIRRVPHEIPVEIITKRYTVEDEFNLPEATKMYSGTSRWHEKDDYTDTAITKITKGSVGDRVFYAQYTHTRFEIDYQLASGESFEVYTKRTDMIDAFLDDFYAFVTETVQMIYPANIATTILNEHTEAVFKHGKGKSSGYGGTYTDFIYFDDIVGVTPVQLLYMNKDTIDENQTSYVDQKGVYPESLKFINQEIYNRRWLPLLEEVALFTKDVKSTDDFWLNPYIAAERLKDYFTNHKPIAENNVNKYFNSFPKIIKKDVPFFHINNIDTLLPTNAIKKSSRFEGWYDNPQYLGNEITEITGELSDTLVLYPKFSQSEFELTYDFGEYGHHSITRNELFMSFINDYITLLRLSNKTIDDLYNDFYDNSEVIEDENVKFSNIFTSDINRWMWIREYILYYADIDNYKYTEELNDCNQEVWRINIDAFLNSRQSEYTNSEGITIHSIDFTNFERANGFWTKTIYNKIKVDLIAGNNLINEEFILNWHPEVTFDGWYLNPEGTGKQVTKHPSNKHNVTIYAKWKESANFGKINITFVDYDDEIIEVVSIKQEELVNFDLSNYPSNPTREHYEFTGWDKTPEDVILINSSTTVKALYKGEVYELSFETYDGTKMVPQLVTYPEYPEEPIDPTNDGYEFVDWYKDDEFTDKFYFEVPLFEDTTIYAKWKPIEYRIIYYLYDGTLLNEEFNPTKYTILDVIEPGPAVKDNYQFVGWYLDQAFTDGPVTVIEKKHGELWLHAKYTINKYTVEFDSDVINVNIPNDEVDHGSKLIEPTGIEKPGFDLDGWYLGALKWDFNNHVVTENMTLVAKWKVKVHEVIFYALEVGDDDNDIRYEVVHGSYVNIPDVPDKGTGYTKSWSEDIKDSPIYKSYYIRPVYNLIEYNINYHLNGGTNVTSNQHTYNIKDIINLASPTRSGYTFDGWFKEEDFSGNIVTQIKDEYGDLDLYAKWEETTYNINYVLDGGDNHIDNPSTYKITDVIFLKDATKNGYDFVGWYEEDSFTTKVEVIEDSFGDITLYAKFDVITYNITYNNLNGASHNNIDTYNALTEHVFNDPSLIDGYTFDGWFTLLEGGVHVVEIEKGTTGDKTFYARWIQVYHEVTFDLNYDGAPVLDKVSVRHGHTVNAPSVSKRDHYTLVAWEDEGNNIFNFSTPIISPITLTAIYEGDLYYLTFEVDGGLMDINDSNPQEVKYPNYPVEPTNPTKHGYEFKGWYKESTFINLFNFDISLNGHTTIYAKWEAEVYNIEYNLDGSVNDILNPKLYTIESSIILKDPIKEGYLFEGWYETYENEEYSNKIEVIQNMTGDITLYAYFSKAIDYNINYVLYLEIPNDTVIFDPTVKTYNTLNGSDQLDGEDKLKRESSYFVGWYYYENYSGDKVLQIPPGLTGDITLYAKWEIKEYTLSFYLEKDDLNNEHKVYDNISNIPHSSIVELITLGSEHIEVGYEFIGWHYLDSNNNSVLFEPDRQVNSDYHLYPEYALKQYVVTFHYGYGEGGVSLPSIAYPIYHGNRLTSLPDEPSLGDLVFCCWETGDGTPFNINDPITSDLDLVVKWASGNDSYLVIFNFNNGKPSTYVSVLKNNKLASIPDTNELKVGHEFSYWKSNGDTFTSLELEDKVIDKNYVFDAIYTINTYTVKFYNDGEIHNTQQVEYGKNATTPAIPVKAGHTFSNWDKVYTNVTENLEINAQFKVNKYSVVFKYYKNDLIDDDEIIYDDEIVANYGSNITPPDIPNRDGYNADGWDSDSYTNVTSNLVIYAQYEEIVYNITYILDNATHSNKETYTITESFILTNPTSLSDGRLFTGWEDSEGNVITMITLKMYGDLELRATWSDQEYTITYTNYNEEDLITGGYYPNTYTPSSIKEISDAERNGYNFLGWYKSGTEIKVKLLTGLTENLILEARWQKEVYEIIYENILEGVNINNVTEYTFGTSVSLNNPTKIPVGTNFMGWYDNSEFTGDAITQIGGQGDKTVYARWEKDILTVTFKNHDNSDFKIVPVEYGSTVSAITGPEKTHYEFVSWNINGQPYDFELEVEKSLILIPTYNPNTYVLTFDSNGGSTVSNQSILYPNRPTEPSTPTKDSCEFKGWFSDQALTIEFKFNQALTGPTTVYAKWELKQYTVKFVDGEIILDTQMVGHGNDAVKPDDPEKVGHDFIGWEDYTNITSNRTVNALYEAHTFDVKYFVKGNEEHTFNVTYGQKIDVPPLPQSESGYKVAWSENLNNLSITKDYEINAIFTPINYSITYENLLSGTTNSNPVQYNIESTFNLVAPGNIPIQSSFVGWFTNSEFTGSKVTSFNIGQTENKTFYAKWDYTTYTITYHGVTDDDYDGIYEDNQREQMYLDFLGEYYDWLRSKNYIVSSISKNDFIHGTNKTSGFNGMYDQGVYFEHLYELGSLAVYEVTEKFINNAAYNKWAPIIQLLLEYIGGVNPEQVEDFYSGYFTPRNRIKGLVTNHYLFEHLDEEDQLFVKGIANKIPDGLKKVNIYYEYNYQSPTIELPIPSRLNQEFLGWYTKETGGVEVSSIPLHSTGNKEFYARWNDPIYNITYELNRGEFTNYTGRSDMLNGFFQDLYDFIKPKESYNDFVHGVGKTSGYDGLWYSKASYKSLIYTGPKPTSTPNNGYFAYHEIYGPKWYSFFDMIDRFTKKGNDTQFFWGAGTYVGYIRLYQYITEKLPGNEWTEADFSMMPNPLVKITVVHSYKVSDKPIILPEPSRPGYKFEGFYGNRNFTGNRITQIDANSTGNRTFYAEWSGGTTSSGDIIPTPVTNGPVYKAGLIRTGTLGVMIVGSSTPKTPADDWYDRWSKPDTQVTTHFVVDNVAIYQYLPENFVGAHTKGPGNYNYLSVMFAEVGDYSYQNGKIVPEKPSAANQALFDATWEKAVSLTVYLLKANGISVVNENTVVGRHEAHNIAYEEGFLTESIFNAPGVLFAYFGKTMNDFRDEVRSRM